MRRTILAAAVSLSLTACGQESSTAPEPGESAAPSPTSTPTPTTSTGPAATPTAGDAAGIPEFGIPATLHGNWGMVPADCTSTRGDAKGLLRISGTTLTFYESVGKLGTIHSRSDTSISASFGFSGEGMTWTREETLALSSDGKQLTRTERGGEEPGGPFTYSKCAA